MNSFDSLALSEELIMAVLELGFETPMPIQQEAIPCILEEGRDLIALAQTGTGKTAAFGLPILQKLDTTLKQPQALILIPTRELCMQIAADLTDYSKYLPAVNILAVYGGASIKNQLSSLAKGVQVIVATPGRLLDLLGRGAADLSAVNCVVLDEADEMLNMGFMDDIDSILASIPQDHRTMLFSATMPDEISRIARQYMHEPKEIVVGRKNEATSTVRHICYTVHASEKYRTLKRIVDYSPRIYGIVFCRTKVECQEIADKLMKDGYNADALHGDLSQQQRDLVMQRFRIHNIQLLVATDVAARGIDVDDLTHVINYTLPDEPEVYIHRSGRTGRAGKAGISIAIVNMREAGKIRQIERTMKKSFEVGKIPTGKDICSKQIWALTDRLENVEINKQDLEDILPAVSRKLEWLSKEDLLKRLVSLEFNRFISYYQDDEDFEAAAGKGTNKVIVQRTEGFTKLFINVGRMDGVGPKELLGMIKGCIRGDVEVGRIDIFTRYTLFDVKDENVETVSTELGTLKLRGRSLHVSPATQEQIDRGLKQKMKKARRS